MVKGDTAVCNINGIGGSDAILRIRQLVSNIGNVERNTYASVKLRYLH